MQTGTPGRQPLQVCDCAFTPGGNCATIGSARTRSGLIMPTCSEQCINGMTNKVGCDTVV